MKADVFFFLDINFETIRSFAILLNSTVSLIFQGFGDSTNCHEARF
jgi:hypothetical protein